MYYRSTNSVFTNSVFTNYIIQLQTDYIIHYTARKSLLKKNSTYNLISKVVYQVTGCAGIIPGPGYPVALLVK